MGFLGFKSKDIKVKQDISGYLVFPFKTPNNRIYLNKKLTIPGR